MKLNIGFSERWFQLYHIHILISNYRDPVPDVPAIYFCQPTDKNIKKIGQDMQNGLYGSYHFNFISPITRQKLEDLASLAIQGNAVTQIAKVFDQYVNFISLENEMFTLRKGSGQDINDASYYSLNRSELNDADMEALLSQVVDGLFAVCVTLGNVPIIRCPKGNAAEAVATRLDKKLRENLKDTRNSLFMNEGGIQVSEGAKSQLFSGREMKDIRIVTKCIIVLCLIHCS